jgi:hypothetical protein
MAEMADIVGSLRRKRAQIEEVLKEQNRREGARKTLLDSLKSDFGVGSIGEAEDELKALDKELDKNETAMRELDSEMGEILEAATNAKVSKE